MLAGLDSLQAEMVRSALADPDAAVRRQAVRLAEPYLDQDAALAARVTKLTDDADPQVHLQAAYSLGTWSDPAAGAVLARVAASPGRCVYPKRRLEQPERQERRHGGGGTVR